jgi:hypothetical protein
MRLRRSELLRAWAGTKKIETDKRADTEDDTLFIRVAVVRAHGGPIPPGCSDSFCRGCD